MRNTLEYPITRGEVTAALKRLLSIMDALSSNPCAQGTGDLTGMILNKIKTELETNDVSYSQVFADDAHFER